MQDLVKSRREALFLGGAAVVALAGCTTATGSPSAGSVATAAPTSAPVLVVAPGAAATAVGAAAATAVGAAATPAIIPSCVLTPSLTEGPYFVDEKLNRSDVRLDPSNNVMSAGVPLTLSLQVAGVNGSACTPLAGATVDIWQCDAAGVYSDVTDRSFSTKGKKFLRGFQTTDADGRVSFTTIYPGWYSGRTVHIHFKVRATAGGKSYEHTSQWFFDDTLSDAVFAQAPYSSRGNRDTRNDRDSIYREAGAALILPANKSSDGYSAGYVIGMKLA